MATARPRRGARRRPRRAALSVTASLALGGAAAAAMWWRRHPSACPYSQRFWVEAPHPLITRRRLRAALGEIEAKRVLEIGPGTGYYTIPVAQWIGAAGRLDIFDLQQEMLDHTVRRANEQALSNVVATQGDARALPYPDATFDAALLVTVLGEIPDQVQALRELRRVVRPGGRVVVGELWGDPHVVPVRQLRERAGQAGFELERRVGPRLGFFAVLRPRAGHSAPG